jgi:anti-sigma B factor antagonist
MPPQHLVIDFRSEQDMAVIRLQGELDLASAPQVEEQMGREEVRSAATVVLDLREVEFIDSTGLRVVFASCSHARERGQEFAVTRGSDQVQRLMDITGVDEHLRVIESPDDKLV